MARLWYPQFVEAARKLWERMMTEGGGTIEGRLALGMELALCRPPRPGELPPLKQFYQQELSAFRSDAAAAERLLGVGQSPRHHSRDTADAATRMTKK